MKIEFFRIGTENILESLAKYRASMEWQLDFVQKEELKKIQAWVASLSSDKEAMLEMAGDEYAWTYDYMFPRSLRYSFMVLLFLILESQLIGLCDEIKTRRGLSLRANELKGDAISRCKAYLKKVVSLPINDHLWDKIEDLAKVRNCIVHALGKVDLSNDKKRLSDLAARSVGLSISGTDKPEEGMLIVTPAYCEQAINDVKQLFEEVFNNAGFAPALKMY